MTQITIQAHASYICFFLFSFASCSVGSKFKQKTFCCLFLKKKHKSDNKMSDTKRQSVSIDIDNPIVEKKAKAGWKSSDVAKEANSRLIFWECKIKRISEIDTARETFRCRFHYYLTWLATKQEAKDYEEFVKDHKNSLEPIGWVPQWVPGVEFTNVVVVSLFEEHQAKYEVKDAVHNKALRNSWEGNEQNYTDLLGFDPNFGKWVRCRYEADMTFAEEFELENFPFDVMLFLFYLIGR
ncbi:hypothetical protein RFI_38606 [Reticulomyxa filosa]|uniref:Uncharacterized protein n=1 Tax=Reticulomyxa filosa TaxID=46433 RepID=X6LC36_RETFI|nr:hypothetical protein RFI_38606 [Reticulomyxa filosa]|eukprot:ETN98880.1 hypothetical protein RFI_38606 [Reticulomyxa filosa]